LTSCPNDCETPPGPFGAIDMSRLNGAVGSSFCPEKTQIEFACVGPAVGLPFPVISPADAALTLTLKITTTETTVAMNALVRILPPFVLEHLCVGEASDDARKSQATISRLLAPLATPPLRTSQLVKIVRSLAGGAGESPRTRIG
jgi:hypothetical protein